MYRAAGGGNYPRFYSFYDLKTVEFPPVVTRRIKHTKELSTYNDISCRLLRASVPYELSMDEEADELLESSLWDIPSATTGGKFLFQRRLGIISNLLHARRRYKVFYDTSSLGMILAYVRGYLFWGEE